MKAEAAHYREQLIEKVSEADDKILEKYLKGEEPTEDEIKAALRKRVNSSVHGKGEAAFVPVVCGSAFGRYHESEHEFRGGDDVLSNVDPSWYFRKPGGGPLYDMTVYSLHALTTVLGPAQRVTALSGTRVKERVYLPDWTEPQRLGYTMRLFDLLAELAPRELEGSVSTLPGSFKEFMRMPEQEQAMRLGIAAAPLHGGGDLDTNIRRGGARRRREQRGPTQPRLRPPYLRPLYPQSPRPLPLGLLTHLAE